MTVDFIKNTCYNYYVTNSNTNSSGKLPEGKPNERTIIMRRNVKAIIAAALAAAMCAAFAGCGKSDPEKDLERDIEKAINEFDKDYGNAGGNTNKNNSTGEIQPVDPFENLNVTFSGISPQSSVSVSGGNSLCKYTVDKESGVSNGDTVTVTAEFKSEQSNKELTETTREYKVEGLSSYAMKLADIPTDALNKFRSQAEDLITTKVSGYAMNKIDIIELDSYSFEQDEMDFIGYYFLAGKPGFKVSNYNKIYCVYKMKFAVTAYEYDPTREGNRRNNEEHITDYQEFYTVCELDNIVLLEDGTCSFDLSSMGITSDYVALSDKFCNYYGYRIGGGSAYSWKGYSDIDSMFNAVVTSQIQNYSYENTVKDN